MLAETLKEKFGYDTPIFTDEIISLFPQYTRAYIFRLIKSSEAEGSLSRLDTGIYYVPQMTPFGPSVITASDVARKRYVESGDNTYGIYSGLILQNAFSATTQMTNTPEIVTNRESTRCRKITIDGMPFIIRKSRLEITRNNVPVYKILQLFTETNGLEITDTVKQAVNDYINKNEISRNSILELSPYFPARTLKNMVCSGVIC